MADLTPEQHALDVARGLAGAGVPIFVAHPFSSALGFRLPDSWQTTTANPRTIDAWRPGMALCAVMGNGLDLVDLDPRNGATAASLDGAAPVVYGLAATPSAGWHLFVRSMGVRSRDDVLPGVDVKAGVDGQGHGFAFIAPTVRVSKVTGEPVAYRWVQPPDLAALTRAADDRSGERLAEMVRAAHGSTTTAETTAADGDLFRDPVVIPPSPWTDIAGTLAGSRHNGVVKLAGSLRGRGGWRADDAVEYMRVRVWPLIDPNKDGRPCTERDFERDIRDVFSRYEDGHNGAPGVPLIGASAAVAQSWRPVDLGPVLSGEHVRAEPSIGLPRADGLRLLYPGKEHTVIGEMESGKSWFAAGSAAAELTKGNHVVYIHFEEADPTDTVDRLRDLGVPEGDIRARFHFVAPNEPVDAFMLAALLDPVPSLVVLDGVNEAMSLHGWRIREEDGAAAFRRYLVKPCTTAVGAAVLSADHVVKDPGARGRTPLGSIHKGNGLTGSLISLENVEPFGRGQKGASYVYVTKDRPGYLRRHGNPSKPPGQTYMGTLVVDDTRQYRQYLDLAFLAPREQEAATPTNQRDADEAAVLATVTKITGSGREANMRGVEANAGISKGRASDAVERLVLRGGLAETRGPNRARIFSVPVGVPEDHLPDPLSEGS